VVVRKTAGAGGYLGSGGNHSIVFIHHAALRTTILSANRMKIKLLLLFVDWIKQVGTVTDEQGDETR
jgi:hypothetical protein